MVEKKDNIDEKIDTKLGIFIEHMNDQFSQVIEAAQGQTEQVLEKMQIIDDRLERVEYDTTLTRLKVDTIKHDTKMLKLRSDKQEDYQAKLKKKIEKLEAA